MQCQCDDGSNELCLNSSSPRVLFELGEQTWLMAMKITINPRAYTLFPHRLPESRLGTVHDSLEAFQDATKGFEVSKTKEYSLVMVTEPKTRRILLGRKHRGFGKGMLNSFGGKLHENEGIADCAARELEEETGIEAPKSQLYPVAKLHFTFDDQETKMVLHVFRLDVISKPQEEGNSSYFKLDPRVVRGCDEISPVWYDNWYDIPLNNMFADDSLWLTQVLASEDVPLYIKGFFHFEPGGQDVNSIRHYFLDIESAGKSLEERLFHPLHSRLICSPTIKEFKEAFAFAKAVKNCFKKTTFGVILDVAGGHGALAAILMLLFDVQNAVVIDPADVGKGSVKRAWGSFLEGRRLEFRHECLRTGLVAELDRFLSLGVAPERILVVACHACQHLSEETLQIACAKYRATAAIMPCCQKDVSPGGAWKQTSRNLNLPLPSVMDLLLAGKVMAWSYDVRMKTIHENITPQNRVILCRPYCFGEEVKKVIVDKSHERLKRAYKKAHQGSRPKRDPPTWWCDSIDPTSLVVGIVIGSILTLAIQRSML
jgi:8-oxo-dGTP pyrophosphatase MutT (NUDIX family)